MEDKRRSRILAIQKNTLVQLVQNYFIRSVGNHYNVNVNVIDPATWQAFANILNNLGPPKGATQWQNSFQCMCTRIRKKVALIRQFNADPADNLSKLDFKIYEMLPTVDFETLNNALFHDDEIALESATCGVDIQNAGRTFQNSDFGDYGESQNNNALFENNDVPMEDTTRDVGSQNEFLDYEEFQEDNEIQSSIAAGNSEETGTASLFFNFEEFENDNRIHESMASSKVERSRTAVIANEDELEVYDEIIIEDLDDSVNDADETNEHIFTSQLKLSKNVAPSSPSLKPVKDAKTSAKIPDVQKERLIQLIQNNFLKAFGRFAGSNGVAIKAQFWTNVAKELNTLGPARTADQWKATFNGIKGTAKAKLADNHNSDNGMVGKPLNRLEEKMVAMYGLDSLDGDQQLGEAGFNYKKTVPVNRHGYNPINSMTSLERSHNRPKSSQVSSTATSGAFESVARKTGHHQSLNNDSSSSLLQSSRAYDIESRNSKKNWSNGLKNTLSHELEKTLPASSDEDEVLREIREETDDEANPPRSTNGRQSVQSAFIRPPQNNSGSSTRSNISEIARIPDDAVRGRSSGRNIHDRTARVRNSTVRRDDGDVEPFARQNRDRSNLRNRYTSYDMVQRSIQQQELFIEQSGRNHAEMIYTSDRNNAQMIGMFTSTLKTLADVARDFLNKNN